MTNFFMQNIKLGLFSKSENTNGSFFLHIFQFLIYTLVSNLLLASLIFLCGFSISWVLLPLSFIFGTVLLIIFYNEKLSYKIFFEIIVGTLLFMLLVIISSFFYNFAWDGNTYHKYAVGLLSKGWNPLRELPSDQFIGEFSGSSNLWVEAYCKFTWILGANIYTITKDIETGKMYTMLGMVMVFVLVFYFLNKKGNKKYVSILVALAASLNPIAIQQFNTFYLDGFLHLCLTMLLIALTMWLDKDTFDRKMSFSLVFSIMIICANIKFTGLLFGGIFCIVYFLLDTIRNYKNYKKAFWKPSLITCGYFAIIAIIAICFAGSTSYMTNLFRHGTLTYPLTGPNKVDIMTPNSPFTEVNHIKNLFISLFSYMENFAYSSGLKPTLKFPFWFDLSKESANLTEVDIRLSGFGIFFSAIFVISLIIIIVKLIKMKKDGKFWFLLTNLLMFVLITISITESWWARYAPCIYFTVLIALYLILKSSKKVFKILGIAFSVLVIFNSALFFKGTTSELQKSIEVSENLTEISLSGPVYVYDGIFPGSYFNLIDKNVDFIINKDVQTLPNWQYSKYASIVWAPRQ